MFLLGVLIGMGIGSTVGFCMVAILSANSRYENRNEE